MSNPHKFTSLNDIFDDEDFYLIEEKKKACSVRNADERLLAAFEEINSFYESNKKEPEANISSVSEFQLYSRLKGLREDLEKVELLKDYDRFDLLPPIANIVSEPESFYGLNNEKKIESLDDILADDFSALDNDEFGLFDFKHTPKNFERAQADFVARRKPCKNFTEYESLLKSVQKDLANGKRSLIPFSLGNLHEGEFYVHNGVLFFLESISITKKEHYKADGTRVREDGRTRCIFENGTESNMLKRSVEKILYTNGKVVTQNVDKVNEEFIEKFGNITDEDNEAGYIYVLKSKSDNPEIKNIQNLYKIGYSKQDVAERVKNAEKEPTYLMASVGIVNAWKCYNINPQKFEQLIHNFFGKSCLELDVFDERGKRHTPREWFIVPYEVIEQAIQLIISGEVVKYRYNPEDELIIMK